MTKKGGSPDCLAPGREEVGRKYPNSEYAVQVQRKIEVGRDQLAAKEMNVARY
jgi:outer membrane protein assembly factor BamD